MTSKRTCGGCTLCCKLLPVGSLGKGANTRCQHQHVGKGCAVYAQLENVSPECRLWSCMWLVDPDPEAAKLHRPDRCHYVIDILPDIARATPDDGGEPWEFLQMQVWVDPAYPEAADDPTLRAWIEHIAATRNMPALIRFGSRAGYTLAPPSMTGGEWKKIGGTFTGKTLAERIEAGEIAAGFGVAR